MELSQYLDPDWLSAIARRVAEQTDRAVQILDVDGHLLCVLGEPAPSAVEEPIIVSGQPAGVVRVGGSDGYAVEFYEKGRNTDADDSHVKGSFIAKPRAH